ncbi:TetR family transcriptional regulator [Roseiarcaceae bacterium H3SJ34-1]|uniref:TetR/AcrR family transcriptional regulator n=1 Tax=Terripilifer ovatus TaxID=3032367 RepID=UPI003AB9606E|nr:TetR family transcriptional regulator [Roseiarcaceae bacterium H3SJ34-1]
MRVSREQVAENRRKILEAAGRLFRERGFEAVTVADVMQAAGLTHGGFYGYFKSKTDLIAEALADILVGPGPDADLAAYAAGYLSPAHRANVAGGCATAALASETLRQAPEARAAMTAGLQQQIDDLSRHAPGDSAAARRQAAIGTWAAMVGALILSRVSDNRALSDEILDQTRAWLRAKGQKARMTPSSRTEAVSRSK